MGNLTLTKTRFAGGRWEGLLTGATGAEAPQLSVVSQAGLVLDPPQIVPAGPEGTWHVRIAVPAQMIGDGISTLIIADQASGETLASFSVMAGVVLDEDIRTELDLLRAEFDMLKRAFRRHCVETM